MLPSCGDAIFLPLSCAADVIVGATTSAAPPEVAPEMMRIASPCDLANALIAGFGPMYVASIAPERSASTAAGPALNVCVFRVSAPRALAKMPFSTPTIAVAWVTFGK